MDLLQCSMSSAYHRGGKSSTKLGHLIDQLYNTEVKWSIKPCIIRTTYTFHWIINKWHPLWRWPAPFFQNICQCNYPTWTKEKILSHTTSVVNKRKQAEDRKTFSYPIFCPLCHLHQRNQIKTKFTQLSIYFDVACQLYTVKKVFYKTWSFDYSIPQYRGEMVYQNMNFQTKKFARHWDRN